MGIELGITNRGAVPKWPKGMVCKTIMRGFESLPRLQLSRVRPGHIGNRSYRRHRLHFWAKRVVERLQSFFLQIDVAEIVLHKADQPNTFFDFFDPQGLSCEDRAEINFFAVQADASAVGDVNDAVVKRISKFWQAAVAADGGSVDFRGALHVQGLMGPLVVEFFEKIIEFALLLQAVPARGARGLRFEREVHAFMPAILLWMTGLDAFDGDAQSQPPDRELGEVEQRVGRGEGHAVVRADASGQAALFK